MRLDERILALLQGLTCHALTQDPSLQKACSPFADQVIRVTTERPYFSFYLYFVLDDLHFKLEHEGDIDARLDVDALALLRALYGPSCLHHLPLEQCLRVPHNPELTSLFVRIVSSWHAWSLLQTLLTEFLPFLGQDNEFALELQSLKRTCHLRFEEIAGLGERALIQSNEQATVLVEIQRQLRFMRYLVGFVLMCSMLANGLLLFLLFGTG